MNKKLLNKMLKGAAKNKKELMIELLKKVDSGYYVDSLALAYIINEFVPDDRTTKHVFKCVVDE